MLTENLVEEVVEDIVDNFVKNHKDHFYTFSDLLAFKDEVRAIIKNEKDDTNCAEWVTCDYKKLEHGFVVTFPGKGIYCSNCRIGLKIDNKWYKFCPNCGKKMKKGK